MQIAEQTLGIDVPSPAFDMPWATWLSGWIGWGIATLVLLTGVVLVIGLGRWSWGKMSGSASAQSGGLTGFIGGVIGAGFLVVAGTTIAWATDIGPDWMDFEGPPSSCSDYFDDDSSFSDQC